jgi:hypothetical protein
VVRNQSALQNVVAGLQNSWVGITPSVGFAANAQRAEGIETSTPLLAQKAGVGADQWVAAVEGGDRRSEVRRVVGNVDHASKNPTRSSTPWSRNRHGHADATRTRRSRPFSATRPEVAAKKIEAAELGKVVEGIRTPQPRSRNISKT